MDAHFCSIWNQILQNSQSLVDPFSPILHDIFNTANFQNLSIDYDQTEYEWYPCVEALRISCRSPAGRLFLAV